MLTVLFWAAVNAAIYILFYSIGRFTAVTEQPVFYTWRIWRLVWSDHRMPYFCQGNNRWRRILRGFYWREDATGPGTRH
jgi:hypothetical protein